VSQITNHHALSQELNLAYDKAIQRFPDQADEIDDVFEAANELHMSLRVIDQCIDTMDSKWAVDTGSKFMRLAHRLISRGTHSKDLFTWRDTPVSWRGAPVENIVYAIEIEADWYMFHFDSFLFHDVSPDEEGSLLSLRTQIRQRTAKDDNAESDVVGHNPQGVPSLVDVLCTLAAHWVQCECGIEIGQAGLDGWKKKGLQLGEKIDLLNAQIQVIESPSRKAAMQADLEQLEAQSKALNEEWGQAHDEADAYRELFWAAREFCTRACGIGDPEILNAALVGFDPTRLQPDQSPSEDRMTELAILLSNLNRDKWESQPWANPAKPNMRAAKQVAPNHRNQFIVRNVKSNAGKPKQVGTASGPSGQSRKNVPQPAEVSEFYRLQKLTKWQGKSKAEIHREIAKKNRE